jgi:hypothetical protein
MAQVAPIAYSADVSARLLVGASRYEVAQTGPDFIVLRQAVDIPAGEATLIIEVEGRESISTVMLTTGASRTSIKVAIQSLNPSLVSTR